MEFIKNIQILRIVKLNLKCLKPSYNLLYDMMRRGGAIIFSGKFLQICKQCVLESINTKGDYYGYRV